MIPIAYALDECQRVQSPGDISCVIISTWQPTTGCSAPMYIFDESGTNIQTENWTDGTPYCNATWNITTLGTYTYNSTIEDGVLVVKGEDNMTSLGVIIFFILINLAIFILPLFVQFTKSIATNTIVKRGMWMLGLAVLAFNTTILASLADNAGLGITHEIFVFQWFFIKGLYVVMILLLFSLIISIPKLWAQEKIRKRMGEE